jgi:NADPH-dependent curcumin reductase CurA
MSDLRNRRIVLAKRPTGVPGDECWTLLEGEPVREPGPGEVLVEVAYLSIDPAMRAYLDEDCYTFRAEIGQTMLGLGVGTVLESGDPDFEVGEHVAGPLGVQNYATRKGRMLQKIDTRVAAPSAYLGALGVSAGITAWVGMLAVGAVRKAQTVVVSGAAGAVGSIAGQIGRIHGARVIGIAGGPEKVAYTTGELGFDACIDYKGEDVHARLGALAPDGVDLFFDNVGGSILDDVLDHIASEARVVICGAISQYNQREDVRGPSRYLRIAERNATLTGFTIHHHERRYGEAVRHLAGWLDSGALRVREHVERGVERYPATLRMLFDGSHTGKLLLAP